MDAKWNSQEKKFRRIPGQTNDRTHRIANTARCTVAVVIRHMQPIQRRFNVKCVAQCFCSKTDESPPRVQQQQHSIDAVIHCHTHTPMNRTLMRIHTHTLRRPAEKWCVTCECMRATRFRLLLFVRFDENADLSKTTLGRLFYLVRVCIVHSPSLILYTNTHSRQQQQTLASSRSETIE